ncbi:ribosome maturation factor RimM [Campylobacter sp. RM9333]|uniref:ribosome maturation factor RimM n=2 Tax=unclassified Campylobacter TaxID=2593542 RepID=UPI001D73E1EC|nr:16S rRNA processing protein RimM [Campylobacter sp. RM9333]
MMNNLVYVAKIGKTHGLLGFLKFHNKSDFYEQFKPKAEFFDKNGKKFIIKSFDFSNSLVQFVGYEDINKAKELVNMELYSNIENTRKNIKLKKDEYFYFDIIGLKVYQDDEFLGSVVDILETGANDLLEIKTSDELVNLGLAKSFYIPFHNNFIISVSDIIKVNNSKSILENS